MSDLSKLSYLCNANYEEERDDEVSDEYQHHNSVYRDILD